MKLEIIKTQQPKQKPQDETKLGFGRIFTDHMLTIEYRKGEGWHNAQIRPFENLSLSPACTVLHYSQTIFEGLKAYHTDKGVNLFRPWDNFKRMNVSARRMCMPDLDEAFILDSLYELIRIEKDWIPKAEGTSLYIRPTFIATDPFVGVKEGDEYLFYIILSPVGAYYASGLAPVDIYVEDQYVRSVVGGTGAAKTGGNYAASLIAGKYAHDKGFSQVLWLDGGYILCADSTTPGSRLMTLDGAPVAAFDRAYSSFSVLHGSDGSAYFALNEAKGTKYLIADSQGRTISAGSGKAAAVDGTALFEVKADQFFAYMDTAGRVVFLKSLLDSIPD
jgi:hypothetical protein